MLWYQHWQIGKYISSWIFKVEQPLKKISYVFMYYVPWQIEIG